MWLFLPAALFAVAPGNVEMCGAGLGFSFFGLRFSRLPRCSLLAMVISIEWALGMIPRRKPGAVAHQSNEALPAVDIAAEPSVGLPPSRQLAESARWAPRALDARRISFDFKSRG